MRYYCQRREAHRPPPVPGDGRVAAPGLGPDRCGVARQKRQCQPPPLALLPGMLLDPRGGVEGRRISGATLQHCRSVTQSALGCR